MVRPANGGITMTSLGLIMTLFMSHFPFFRYILRRVFLPQSPVTMEWHMLRLLNRDRKEHGFLPVVMQDDLREVARKHSRDMARHDYFSHTNLDGKSPSDRLNLARVTDAISGENLAKIGGFSFPTVRAEEGLMNSPGHRANILNAHYNCVGIGVVKSATGVYYFTQNFAHRGLIFDSKVRKVVRLKHGLKLRGKILVSKSKFFLQIDGSSLALSNPLSPPSVHPIPIRNGRFDVAVSFAAPGDYLLTIYTFQKKRFLLLNRFEVHVKKGWW